jgi:hypothetical protein
MRRGNKRINGLMRLIYFSPVPAASYAQRPHFTAQAWLELGAESILWVDPYPCRLPRLNDLRLPRRSDCQNAPLDSRVEVLRPPALPIEPLPGGAWINDRFLWRGAWQKMSDFADDPQSTIIGIGRPCALAHSALRRLPHSASFYDAMDNFPEFHGGLSRRSIQYYEDAIASTVDLVLASSTYLTAKYVKRGLNVKKVLNAYHMSNLPSWRPVAHRHVVLGYVGCLGPWFDWPLVLELARRMPHVRFELVGPRHAPLPARLPENISVLPPCEQSEAQKHLARFSVGLIPFRNNSLTAGVDPIKYYEYRAAGLPVLTTSFGEMALRKAEDGVFFMDQANDLPSLVANALGHRDDPAALARFRRDHDWTERLVRSSPFHGLFDPFVAQRAA